MPSLRAVGLLLSLPADISPLYPDYSDAWISAVPRSLVASCFSIKYRIPTSKGLAVNDTVLILSYLVGNCLHTSFCLGHLTPLAMPTYERART